uniref:Uncharacterized protein n=1 Tax=Avena sativa TaxID=4498 RepID=A0ACD5TE16_AVESA
MTRLPSASLRRVSAVTKHEGEPCCPALWPQNLLLLLPRLLSPSLLADQQAGGRARKKLSVGAAGMAATADPRAKPPVAPTTHHLEPWARQPRPHRVRVPAHHAAEDSPSEAARDRRRSSSDASRKASVDHEGGIDGLRAKLVGHLRDAADRLRVPKPSTPLLPPPPKEPETMAPPAAQEQQQQQLAEVEDKPWKLRERTRRRPAALTSWPAAPSPSRRRKRAPFSVSLSPEEIEEDIYSLTGGRPRRRPRKRPRAVQRQLDSAFPGLWLTEITADDYKVPDPDEE